jgi:chromosome segregation ATPase
MPDAVESAREELYGLDPEQFMARRGELAAAARSAGDVEAAKRIGALRKPTQSAYAVNLLVRAQPDAPEQIAELGAELRAAQQRLDGTAMRELSNRRNALLDELGRAALRAVGRAPTATALRDEIVGTLSAALADPDVLDQLRAGALVRAEKWSGLGLADAPALALVPSPPPSTSRPARTGGDAEPAVQDKAQQRRQAALDKAEQALAEADERVREATTEVTVHRRAVRRAEDQLADARRQLDDAELDLRRARAAADKARAAFDRARR